jgi:hypothetical protein
LTLFSLNNAIPFAAGKQRHQEMKIIIGVRCKRKWRQTAGPCFDPQFFMQLTDKRAFGYLTGLNLAPWKFPQPCHGFTLGSLCQQNASIGVN